MWQCTSREECLVKYRGYFASASMQETRLCLRHLAGKKLACPSCRLDETCHGDIIIEGFLEWLGKQSQQEGAAVEVGIPYTEEEFLQRAKELQHPFDHFELPDQITRNIASLLIDGTQWMKDHRDLQMKK
jgi:hypothetical protein